MLATSPFSVSLDSGISCRAADSGFDKWLKNNGLEIEKTMVLDSQNFPLPIPTHRTIAGFRVEETQLAPYPYFVDIRSEGMDKDDPIVDGLGQVVMNWASPIRVDKDKNKQRRVFELLHSSPNSWTSTQTSVEPNYSQEQQLGFPIGKDKGAKLLAVCAEGQFQSFFKNEKLAAFDDKSQPQTAEKQANDQPEAKVQASTMPTAHNIIEKSPDSARLILFASNEFLSDKLLWLASESLGSRYTKPIELIQNAIDWSLEDRDLLSIRGRSHFARTLKPMSQSFEIFFEYLNYGLAVVGLGFVWLIRRQYWLRMRKRFEQILQAIPKLSVKEEANS